MRYIQTSNKHIQFIEADGSDNIIASKGFAFNELYYQIANGKVSFYLNDSETPYRNDVWSINLPATIDGEEYDADTIAEALAALFAQNGGGGGDLSDYYTKEQTDDLLLQKSDLDDTYTIEEVDDLLDDKLDASAYTPCDLSEYYTSAQTESRLADKLDVSAYTPSQSAGFQPIPQEWNTGSMAQLIASINADSGATPGNAYLGTISVADLPESMSQGEMEIQVLSELQGLGKVILFTVTSDNVEPYHWEYTSSYGATNVWRSWATTGQLEDDEQIWATALNGLESRKADKTGIKTINGQSLIGEGDITVGTGGTITIDDHLDSGSSDAVANSAITLALDALEDALDDKADKIDTYTKSEVDALVASGGGGVSISGVAIWPSQYPLEVANDKGLLCNSLNIANSGYSTAFGFETTASGEKAFAQGVQTTASGLGSHSEGLGSIAGYDYAHAEGEGTTASGLGSHSEGYATVVTGEYSHVEGYQTSGTNVHCHAEGHQTLASGIDSHAEGQLSTASTNCAHAEGLNTLASGKRSHSEGENTVAAGDNSHASGEYTSANTKNSATFGYRTETTNENEFACGAFNKSTSGTSVFTVGGGTSSGNRKNWLEVSNTGKISFYLNTNDANPSFLGAILKDLINRVTALENR